MNKTPKEILADIEAELGPHAMVAADAIVAGSLLATHCAEHCEELAADVKLFTATMAAQLAALGGVDLALVTARTVTLWNAVERGMVAEASASEIAEAVIARAQAKPEDIN